ncbi:MAG: hypothetical protein ACRD1Z_08990 [Vicinamibacteria bacterium]
MGKQKMSLGELRKNLLKRYEDIAEPLRSTHLPDIITHGIEKKILELLREFGIDYPRKFDIPPPDVYVPARQGTQCLDPLGSTDGASPPVPTDEKCLTFRARDSGFLVIDSFDIIMEDPIAEDWFTIKYTFDKQENSANFQHVKSDDEPGHWKFNRVILVDGEVMRVCIKNTNPFAGGCFSFEGRMWSL